jgi:hypothetical protein
MGAMMNHNPFHDDAGLQELLELAHVGSKQRPVKVVEHPTFRAARARIGLDAPFTVLRLPVVSLNPRSAISAGGCGMSALILEAA